MIVDLGCGLGQDLRLFASHGVPTENMWALDIQDSLWKLGYELFRDADKMKARLIVGDFRTMSEDGELKGIQGTTDVIIAAQFVHLFDWDGQVAVFKKIVGLSKVGTMVVGHQQGLKKAVHGMRPWGAVFHHNEKSFQEIWQIIARETGTEWRVDVKVVELSELGMNEEDTEWMPEDQMGIRFVVTRVS